MRSRAASMSARVIGIGVFSHPGARGDDGGAIAGGPRMDEPGGGARAAREEPRRSRGFGALTSAIGRATDRAEEGVPAALSILAVRAAERPAPGGAADDSESRSASVRASLDAMAGTDAPAPAAQRRPSRLESIVRESPPREESVDDSEPLGTGLALSGGGIRSATFS